VVAVDDLLRALLLHLDNDVALAPRQRAEAVVFDLLTPVSVTTITLPMPTDPRALEVASALVHHPADQRSLAAWGDEVGASARTLSRHFRLETGLTFGQWRTQNRLRAALDHLAAGMPIGNVAREIGYETASAFVASFRRATGQTPGAYFAASPR
jgi:AraC-like DNA-binding protein